MSSSVTGTRKVHISPGTRRQTRRYRRKQEQETGVIPRSSSWKVGVPVQSGHSRTFGSTARWQSPMSVRSTGSESALGEGCTSHLLWLAVAGELGSQRNLAPPMKDPTAASGDPGCGGPHTCSRGLPVSGAVTYGSGPGSLSGGLMLRSPRLFGPARPRVRLPTRIGPRPPLLRDRGGYPPRRPTPVLIPVVENA